KLQTISEADFSLFHATFGQRATLKLVETGIMPSARGDYRSSPNKLATCSCPNDYFFIAHDGRVALCCSDQDLMHVFGDLKTQTIDQIWFDPKNQLTFRNIGTGIGVCPEVCTKHCHLAEPKPGFYEVAVKKVRNLGFSFSRDRSLSR
ncbi:MAG: SPASM domain-containing protein, partial [Alphaproteobacteria bacterium]|nr:SPASM domain-containing protein [Alphaproteobacteria bacterium]